MPLPLDDDQSPSSTNPWGDVVDVQQEPQQSLEPSIVSGFQTDSFQEPTPGASSSTEPEEFKRLSPSDQSFLKTLDTKVAAQQLSGEYYGAGIGLIACTLLNIRLRRTMPGMPRAALKKENYLLHQATDPLNHILIGTIAGRVVTNKQGWAVVDRKFEESPAVAARIQTAFEMSSPHDTLKKYRRAWYNAQPELRLSDRLWYNFSYLSS